VCTFKGSEQDLVTHFGDVFDRIATVRIMTRIYDELIVFMLLFNIDQRT